MSSLLDKYKRYSTALENRKKEEEKKNSFYTAKTGFTFGVSSDYINTFAKDASDFLSSSYKEYEGLKKAGSEDSLKSFNERMADLQARAKKIKAYTRAQSKTIPEDTAKSLNELVANFTSSSTDLSNAYNSKVSNLSKFDTDEDYEKAVRTSSIADKYKDSSYEDRKTALYNLEATRAEQGKTAGQDRDLDEEIDWLKQNGIKDKYKDSTREDRQKALNNLEVQRAEEGKLVGDDPILDEEIDYLKYYGEREGYKTSAEYDEEIQKLYWKKDDLEAKYLNGEKFTGAEQARDYKEIRDIEDYIGTLERDRDELKKQEQIAATYGKYAEAADFADKSGYVSTAKNLTDAEIEALGYKKAQDGSWYKNTATGATYYDPYGDAVYEYINADDKTQSDMMLEAKNSNGVVLSNEDEVKMSKYSTYAEMTDEEVKIYNYLYSTSPEDAAKYLEELSPTLDKRFNAKETQRYIDMGYESDIGASLISVISNMQAGVNALPQIVADLAGADGSKLDSSSRMTSALRAGAGKKWAETIDFDIPLLDTNAGEFLYNSLMSIADMGTATAMGGAMGGTSKLAQTATQFIMSSQAAANEIYSAHEQGLSGVEAAARGIISGAVEAITEKASIENLFSTLKNPNNILKSGLRQAFFESTEEGAATLLNSAVDLVVSEIAGHANEIENAAYDLIKDGSSPETAYKEALQQYAKSLGTDILAGALTGALMGGGGAVISNTANAISTRADTNADLAKISDAVAVQLESAGETGDIPLISEAIARQAAGKKLSKVQAEAISSSNIATEIARQFTPESINTGDVSSQRATEIGTTSIAEAEAKAPLAPSAQPRQASASDAVLDNVKRGAPSVASVGGRFTVEGGENGGYNVSVTARNGNTESIDMSEVDVATPEARIVKLAEAQKMSPATVQTLLNTYDGRANVVDFVEEADYVYAMGKTGVPKSQLSRGLGLLSTTAKEMLYEDGAAYAAEEVRKVSESYRTLTERTSGVITAGTFDTSAIKGLALTKAQTRNIRVAKALSDLGFNIKVVRDVSGNAKASGSYNPNSNVIEVNINASSKGLDSSIRSQARSNFVGTLAHEIDHQFEVSSPAEYAEYSRVVLSAFEASGNLEGMLTREVERLRDTGRYNDKSEGEILDLARRELVARASENMLQDSDAIKRVIEENRTVGEKIVDIITKFVEKLRSLLNDIKGDRSLREEAVLLEEMVDYYEEAKEKWAKAFVATVKNVAALNEAIQPGETIVNAEGEVVLEATEDGTIMFNEATYEEEGRDKLRVFLEKEVKAKRLSNKDAADILVGLERIYDTIHQYKDKYAPYGKWAEAKVIRDGKGKPVFSVVTPNGEYKMNIDFSLVCKKRRMLDAVLNRMINRGMIDEFDLGKEQIVKINNIIKENGFEIACALCFVDAKRFRQAGVADSFVDIYNGIVNDITPEGVEVPYFNFGGNKSLNTEGKGLAGIKVDNSVFDRYIAEYGARSVEGRVAKHLKKFPADRKLLSRGDFLSTAGFDAVKTQKPEILKLFNAKKGSGGPKSAFSDTQYLNEIIEGKAFEAKKAYSVGGVRVQSFSDYVARLVFDYCQMVADLSAKQLPAHAYSKEDLFVMQFGKTGIKINMSLIPKIVEGGVAPGLDANGNYAWADESFDFDKAKKIQDADGYTDNCGTICVGVSTEHILKLLDDPDIRMVIPYHKSGLNPIVAELNKIDAFKDYTYPQNTRYRNADGTAGSKLSKADLASQPNINELMQNGMDAKAAAQEYLKWCEENNYVPKFDQFKGHENYYKLLIDFVVYNKNGEFVPQGAVKMNFPTEGDAFGTMGNLIKQGLEADAVTQYKQDQKLDPIVDEIAKVLKSGEVMYSEETSPRENIADALGGVTMTDAEKAVIEDYRAKAKELDALEAELKSVGREIKEMSFTKGKRDTAKLAELKGRKAVLEKEIQSADRKLLELEGTKMLKDVLLRREKQLRDRKNAAVKQAKADAKAMSDKKLTEALAESRSAVKKAKEGERLAAEAEIAEIKRKALEREYERRRRDVRNTVKERAKNLVSYISNQTDKKNVKEGIKGASLEFLRVILKESGMFTPSEMRGLRNAYDALKKDNTPTTKDGKTVIDLEFKGAYAFEIMEDIQSLEDTVAGRAWRDLTLEELAKVNEVTANLRTMIRKENKIFREGRAEERVALAKAFRTKAESSKTKKAKGKLDKFLVTDNTTPVYFFKRIGGVLESIFNDVVIAQNKATAQYNKAAIKLAELKEKYNFKKWYKNKATTITTEAGAKFKITAGQAMYIYAVDKREKNLDFETNHLREGGIVTEDVVKQGKKENRTDEQIEQERIPLTEKDLSTIFATLTDEQKAMADDMVKYLSEDMSVLGNEVSMRHFGIKKYKETYYIPFKVSSMFRHKSILDDFGNNGAPTTKLKDMSGSHGLQKGANQPLVVTDIFDVWSEHVVEMSNYYAFVTPIEAIENILNFRYEDGSTGEYVLKQAYGENALSYLKTFARDLNGGAVSLDKTMVEALVALNKKAKVAASLSVVIQQPTAIIRAAAEIDPKYLMAAKSVKTDSEGAKLKLWERMKRYAPGVTVTKEMGRFDTGSGMSAREFINPDSRAKNLAEAANQTLGKLDDILGKPAEWGDRIAWMQIWKAVEAEVKAKTNLRGEAFYEAVGERFTEVVNKTQVYDSVLSKSAHMRSKDPIAVAMTAFKAESTLTLNLLADSLKGYAEARRSKDKAAKREAIKRIARAGTVYVVQTIVNAALVSLVYAGRDDDDEKTYAEKYVAALSGKLVDEFTMLGNIPFVSDVASLAKGYDTDRMELTLIKSVFKASQELLKEDVDAEAWIDFGASISDLFGIPAKNLIRDAMAVVNTITSTPLKETDKESIEYSVREEFANSVTDKLLRKAFGVSFDPAYAGGMFDALDEGDYAKAREIRDGIYEYKLFEKEREAMAKGDEFDRKEAEENARTALQTKLTNHYKPLYLAAYEAKDYAEMERIKGLLRRADVYKKNVSEVCSGWVNDSK